MLCGWPLAPSCLMVAALRTAYDLQEATASAPKQIRAKSPKIAQVSPNPCRYHLAVTLRRVLARRRALLFTTKRWAETTFDQPQRESRRAKMTTSLHAKSGTWSGDLRVYTPSHRCPLSPSRPFSQLRVVESNGLDEFALTRTRACPDPGGARVVQTAPPRGSMLGRSGALS